MEYILVVTRPFGGYRRGDVIENTTIVEDILAGEYASSVVRVATFRQGV